MATTTVDPTTSVLEVLNQFSNYKRWSLAVKNYLLAEDLWDVVADTTKPPGEGESIFKTWRRDNARALRIIQNCCGTYNSNFVNKTSLAKDAWNSLAEMYEPVFFDITDGQSSAVSNNQRLLGVFTPVVCSSNIAQHAFTPVVCSSIDQVLSNDDEKLIEFKEEQSSDSAIDGNIGHSSVAQESVSDNKRSLRAFRPVVGSSMCPIDDGELIEFKEEQSSDAAINGNTLHLSDRQELVSNDDYELKRIEVEQSSDTAIDGNSVHLSDTHELVLNDDFELKRIKVEQYSDTTSEELSDIEEFVSNDNRKLKEIKDIKHNANEHEDYKGFFNEAENGNWPFVMEFLVKNPRGIRKNIPKLGCAALRIAVLKQEPDIVKQLVDLMKEEDLEIRDESGFTAFYYAVSMDNIQMAKCMVEKNEKLPSIGFPPDGMLPVLWAYAMDHWEMARYLYHNTPLIALKGQSGAELISQSFKKENVDIAWDLLQHCPSLAVATNFFGHSPLNALAGMRSAFLSGKRLKFWEQWIYDSISIKSTLTMAREINPPPATNDVRKNGRREETDEDCQRNINLTGTGLFRRLATSLLKLLVSGQQYDHIYQMKSVHVRCLAFLNFMCKVTKNKNLKEMQLRFVQSAIFRAIERGHIEFITHFLKENPEYKWMTDAKGMNMFQFAVECRQEKVYSLIYKSSKRERRILMEGSVDNLNNTVLHLVGRLPAYGQLDRIKDAALRMQRELQWFKEVESIAPQNGDAMNITDNMTPHELFTKNHKELKKEGEKSMKGTATSCTVVGTLIITMMFAAAFTVPGEKNGETGIPNLLYKKLLMVYLVSDAISLCFSSTSVIIFLGILTSRYAEVDFLKSLPTKMIFGLVTLFLAVTTMMITFACAIYIMFEGKSGTGILVILLGAIPVISFVLMQFQLLKEMMVSTYGGGIFIRN